MTSSNTGPGQLHARAWRANRNIELEKCSVHNVLSACPGSSLRVLIAADPLVSLAAVKARRVASRDNGAPCQGHRFSATINRWLADQWLQEPGPQSCRYSARVRIMTHGWAGSPPPSPPPFPPFSSPPFPPSPPSSSPIPPPSNRRSSLVQITEQPCDFRHFVKRNIFTRV